MGSSLLDVPAELVDHERFEGCQQLVPEDLLRALADARELRRHDDPQDLRRQRTQHGGMAFEEHAKLAQPWVRDDVYDNPTSGWVDADWKTFREVPCVARVALADSDVGQV